MSSFEFYIRPPEERFNQSPEDFHLAKEGVVKYIAGVAFLHDPDNTSTYHRFDLSQQCVAKDYEEIEKRELFVQQASLLIVAGLKSVIRYSNTPENRGSLKAMGSQYGFALPNIIAVQDAAYQWPFRTRRDFPYVAAIRPMPVLYEDKYRRFCHSDYLGDKLPLTQLMDDIPIDRRLVQSLRIARQELAPVNTAAEIDWTEGLEKLSSEFFDQ